MKTASTFRNWHKAITNTQKKELSSTFPISASGNPDKIGITIRDEFGKRLQIELSKEDSAMFLMQIDRIQNPEKYKKS